MTPSAEFVPPLVGTPTRRRSDCTVEWQLVVEDGGPAPERRAPRGVDVPPASALPLPMVG